MNNNNNMNTPRLNVFRASNQYQNSHSQVIIGQRDNKNTNNNNNNTNTNRSIDKLMTTNTIH
jgi:hypothetical protein